MPSTPSLEAFPANIRSSLLISPPSTPTPPRSLLILLHGLGDTHAPFSRLGQQLNLPHTCTLSIRAPSPLPALFLDERPRPEGAWHWGDDILVDESNGGIDLEGGGFSATVRVLGEVLKTVMGREGGGFEMRDVFFFGFGQGGVVALSLAEALGGKELGGVVAVGGRLPGSRTAMKSALEVAGIKDTELASGKKARTSVILCGGNRGTVVTSDAVADLKARFETVTYTKWAREGDGMMRNREEMLPIMKFLASRLRMPAPEGMEEVGGFQA